tara:strand:- start:5266 stop:5688 length:423 start_codon:yes stop_codon:yes gene_type:complete
MNAKLDEASETLGISKKQIADFISGMACGSFDRAIEKKEAGLAAQEKPMRGPKFSGVTNQVSVDSTLGERLARHAKALRLSRAWLFHHVAEDIIGRLAMAAPVEAPVRMEHNIQIEDFPPVIAEQLRQIRMFPRSDDNGE